MTDKPKPMEFEEMIPFIEESTKCTTASLYNITSSLCESSYPRRLAMAMANIETTMSILKRTEEDLKFYLVEHLKNAG